MKRPKTEVDLSPIVQDFWKHRGYCVHGEVALFKTSLFIDHVAHTGPCCQPDHVVGIEMKKGAGKSLQKQLSKLDKKHVVDEIWGAVIANPREDTISQWEDLGKWLRPGLIVWGEDGISEIQECKEKKAYKRKIRKDRLLLVEENRDALGGYPAQAEDNVYVTHWKRVKTAAKNFVLSYGGAFKAEDLEANVQIPELQLYKNPTRTILRALRDFEEQERIIRQVGKDDKKPVFERYTAEDDDLIDERFLDLFEM